MDLWLIALMLALAASTWGLIALYLLILVLLVKPLGSYMARVFDGTSAVVRACSGFERAVYRLCAVDPATPMDWRHYTLAVLIFNLLGGLLVYALQRLQALLPLNPQHLPAVSAGSAFDTAVSFITNTNWQGYAGESTMSYLTQMLGLAVQNFLSAATGIAVVLALIRGFRERQTRNLGNFWVDLNRCVLYVLLPLSVILALLLVEQGVVQTFGPYQNAALVNPISVSEPVNDAAGNPIKDAHGNPRVQTVRVDSQTIPLGPAAGSGASTCVCATARERVLVAVGPDAQAERLVRAGKRAADRLNAEWLVIYVETPALMRLSDAERNRRIAVLRLATQLGAEAITLGGSSVVAELLGYARARNVTRLLVGSANRPHWRRWWRRSVTNELLDATRAFDVVVIGGEASGDRSPPIATDTTETPAITPQPSAKSPWPRYLLAVLATLAATLLCALLYWLSPRVASRVADQS